MPVHRRPVPVGNRFGRLVVLADLGARRQVTWIKCRCDCGTVVERLAYSVYNGLTRSCGCLWTEACKRGWHRTHGLVGTPEYGVWATMKNRCYDSNSTSYKNYGARGITMSASWRKSPLNFLADMGKRPFPGASIERINNNGPYSKGNCKWATRTEQASNTRRTRWLTYKGVAKTCAQWADHLGFNRGTFHNRLYKYGWTVQRAIETPLLGKGVQRKSYT